MAGVRLGRHYPAGMRDAGWDHFILIGSESAFNVPVSMIHYGVQQDRRRGARPRPGQADGGHRRDGDSVLPGPTLSEGVAAMLKQQMKPGQSLGEAEADFVKANRPSSIIGHAASVEEVANMIVYAASPQASATTGAALRVDGGVIDSLM